MDQENQGRHSIPRRTRRVSPHPRAHNPREYSFEEEEYEQPLPRPRQTRRFREEMPAPLPSRPLRPPTTTSPRPPIKKSTTSLKTKKPGKKNRRNWPWLLSGCALGTLVTIAGAIIVVLVILQRMQVLPNLPGLSSHNNAFQSKNIQSIPLTTLQQLHICDKIGNVNVMVDPAVKELTVLSEKTVHAASQEEANLILDRMLVEIQPPNTIQNPLTCISQASSTPPAADSTPTAQTNVATNSLFVNVTVPDPGNVLLPNASNSVDITIKIPSSALPNNGPTMQIAISAPYGNVSLDHLSGLFDIKGSTGDIKLTNAILISGSHIETGVGNIIFDGRLAFPAVPDSKNPARFLFLCERGNIDVTLPGQPNLTLDANTNIGSVKSEFAITVNNNGGPVNYHGPLNPEDSSGTPTNTATLVLNNSTGDIMIHQAKAANA